MSGTYMAERPIADIIYDAIVNTLQKKNYKVDADSNLVLSGELINLTFKPRMGFFTGNMLSSVEMNFKLINKKIIILYGQKFLKDLGFLTLMIGERIVLNW